MSSTDQENPVGQYEEMVSVAKAVMGGKMTVIEASRRLLKLRQDAGMAGDDLFHPFLAIDFETHHLPVGAERAKWPSDLLAKKDQEIAEVEELFREQALAACSRVVEKLEPRLRH